MQARKHREKKGHDPGGVGITSNNIFGLPTGPGESRLVFIPVPWDVTASRLGGTSRAPAAILEQSYQIDLYDDFAPHAWKEGMAMDTVFADAILQENDAHRPGARRFMDFLESGGNADDDVSMQALLKSINLACGRMVEAVQKRSEHWLLQGKIPLVVGGDHSVPLGLIRALAEQQPGFGTLHIDAHADLRPAYMGLLHSHASIMHNALKLQGVKSLTQVGIRELSEQEALHIRKEERIHCFADGQLQEKLMHGESWTDICSEIVATLPERVYVSIDVDGLDPSFSPHTGTPVPGGPTYNQLLYLLREVVRSGRRLIGADLVETAAHPFDAAMACRLLYKLAACMIRSH